MPGAFLHPFAKPTREQFITIARGQGALWWDADGNELVDAMASLWYCQVGHGRREIADGNEDTVVKDNIHALKPLAPSLGVLAVHDNAAVKLIDVPETSFKHPRGQLFATNSACAEHREFGLA